MTSRYILFFQFEVEKTRMEYVELVSYCANKGWTSGANLSITMVTLLNKIADDSHQVFCWCSLYCAFFICGVICMSHIVSLIKFVWQARSPFDTILRLYAAGLHLINSDVKSRGGDLTSSGGAKWVCYSNFMWWWGYNAELSCFAWFFG